MKPIVFLTLEYPPFKGGIATYLANLAAQFPKGSVYVLAPEGPKGAGDKETHEYDMHSEIPIYRRPLLSKWLRPRWLSALFWANWLCRREKASMLVVSHVLPMGIVAMLLKRWRGTPYAVILHGMDIALALEAGGSKRARAAKVLANADFVVANSAFTAGMAESLGVPKNRMMLVHPCPSFPRYVTITPGRVQETREKYHFSDAPFTVLTLGRLVRRKGFHEAVEAIALLKERGRKATLVIGGDGPERRDLLTLAARRGVAERVVFTGRVPDEDLPALYASCNAFVMAPRSEGADVEGFGIVYLEAGLMARPVIASRAGGVPEAVQEGTTGILVEPGSPDAIADAIAHLMDDQGLAARLGREGRERAAHDFTWRYQAAPLVAAITGLRSPRK